MPLPHASDATIQVDHASRRRRHGAGITGVTAQAARRKRHGHGTSADVGYARAGVAAHQDAAAPVTDDRDSAARFYLQ